MIDFASLMNFAFENRLYESEVHGIEHWHQVEYNGMLLAKKTGADMDVAEQSAFEEKVRAFVERELPKHIKIREAAK